MNTHPSIQKPINPRVQTLLNNEEMVRTELAGCINTLLEEYKIEPKTFVPVVKQVLIAFQDYLISIEELSNTIKRGI